MVWSSDRGLVVQSRRILSFVVVGSSFVLLCRLDSILVRDFSYTECSLLILYLLISAWILIFNRSMCYELKCLPLILFFCDISSSSVFITVKYWIEILNMFVVRQSKGIVGSNLKLNEVLSSGLWNDRTMGFC